MLSVFFLMGTFTLAGGAHIYGQSADAGKANQGQLHGGIIVGLEGIRAAVIRVAAAEQGNSTEVAYTREINAVMARNQTGQYTAEVIKATGQSVLKLYTHMRQQHQVPSQQIYIVGSSDLNADALDGLVTEVRNNTGRTMTFLSLESEVQLGIIGTIPRRYQEGATWFDNRSQSVLIDIGGHKTKGGYQQIRQPLSGEPFYDFVAVGITNLADERSIRTALRKELEGKPGLAHRKKVYLKGAIVLAMVTLLHPEDRQPFVAVTADDINTFYQRAVNSAQDLLNPDLSQIRNDKVRTEAEKDLAAVKNSFTSKRLVAGAEILKAVASEYNFQNEGKKLLFARFSNFSPILSYVLLQAENGPQP